MNTFNEETNYSGFNGYNMAPSDNQGPERQRSPMVDSENSRHSTAGRKGDSALTAFLRSKKRESNQSTLSTTQHTTSTFDTFAQEDQEWGDDDDVADDESIDSIDVDNINNYLCPQPSYNVDDESIASIDINDIKQDMIPVSSYNEDAVDEALKWTEAFMDHDDDDSSSESSMEEPLHDSSFNQAFEKLTSCMERSALTRKLVTQYSEKSLCSSTSALDVSQRSFNHQDSLRLLDPLGHSLDPALGHSSSHSIGHSSMHSITSGLAKTRIKKATRSGLIRRHSHRSLSGQDITKSLNGSLNSISLHGNSSLGNMPRPSSVRNTKLSQDTSGSLMESPSNLSLRVKARLSQNVNKRRMLDQHFVFAAPKLKAKPTSNDMVQRFSQSMSCVAT
jgi:hypothetical protein